MFIKLIDCYIKNENANEWWFNYFFYLYMLIYLIYSRSLNDIRNLIDFYLHGYLLLMFIVFTKNFETEGIVRKKAEDFLRSTINYCEWWNIFVWGKQKILKIGFNESSLRRTYCIFREFNKPWSGHNYIFYENRFKLRQTENQDIILYGLQQTYTGKN